MMNIYLQRFLFAVLSIYLPLTLWATPVSQSLIEKNDFQFEIPAYHTTRQSGQTVNIYVKYAYKTGLSSSLYPDYRELRTEVLSFMEPTSEFPSDVYWEVLATTIGKSLMKHYPLEGVSLQLVVLDNPDPNRYEPGDHGPIFTIGNISPVNHQ